MLDERISALRLDEFDATPMYMQLARKLSDAIESGRWTAGEALPSERTLVDALSISRVTARRAIKLLAEQGLVRKDAGVGTFIAPRFQQPLSKLHTFSDMVRPTGIEPQSELILFEKRRPTDEETVALNVSSQDMVACIARLRKADTTPISLDYATLPGGLLPTPDAVRGSLYDYLDKIGKPVLRATQRHKAAIADEKLADLLAVPIGSPLGLVIRLSYTTNDEPVELTTTYCVNEHYEFVVELQR
ncbi:GntR family transcriptional regulator [Novosphingobium terrae]|uniref:GntR family transcriptional regulator n=1 Tax=Novosphingobium terrae TaxID=2726189 RepID=UPI00197CD2A7|nr:GntR family transcriptional regulator [Novosphingobium terrae]